MEALIGVVLVIIAALEIWFIIRTVGKNVPKEV
jgi:hypothetical protein